MDDIRIAVVGLGSRGRAWIGHMLRIGGYRITTVCDTLPPLFAPALDLIEYRDDVTACTRYEDVLSDPRVDAIALTVRCFEQGGMAAQGLEAGKHVAAEVPAAHSLDDCWRLVVAAETSACVYLLAEQTRYWGFVDVWRDLVASGKLGHVTLCEGQYFHHYTPQYQDPVTGSRCGPGDLEKFPEAKPNFLYHMPPIHYLPHELSPMLKVLHDRVVEVTAMSTRSPSYTYPEFISPDMQVALMKTEKDTILRMATSFSQIHPPRDNHWYHLSGTAGCVEWSRSKHDKPKLWLADAQMHDLADVDWRYQRTDAPDAAGATGHGGSDYYPLAAFRDAVLHGAALDLDVYRAMDTAAPAILAADSIEQGTVLLRVPDFRPGPHRAKGQMPASA